MSIQGARIPPETERARLRAVEQIGVVGTEPEERFDQILRVAKLMFGVPMSSISVVDDRHQWFKSVVGLGTAPIPREQTVCQVTVARAYREPADPIYILEDASTESDFACLPGIGGDGGVRFYAGHPLYGPGGHPVGVFCIYDSVPRTLDSDQLTAFAELAAWAQRELEQSAELARAAEVQRQLLPRELADIPGYDVAALCVQAYSVGGDFYDHYATQRGAYFTVVDVMGKGMGAAILTASVRSALRGTTRALDPVADAGLDTVFGIVSEQLADDFDRTGSFATAFQAFLRPDTNTVSFVDAGHGIAFLREPDGSTTALPADGLPLGIGTKWTERTVQLAPGAMLVVCSDGLLDIITADSDRAVLASFISDHATPAALAESVLTRVSDSISLDDVTVLAVSRAR